MTLTVRWVASLAATPPSPRPYYLLACEMEPPLRQELTHPLPVIRARELVKFSQSPQYLGLVRRGLPL